MVKVIPDDEYDSGGGELESAERRDGVTSEPAERDGLVIATSGLVVTGHRQQ